MKPIHVSVGARTIHRWRVAVLASCLGLFGADCTCGRPVGYQDPMSEAPWPMLGANPMRTWRSDHVGPQTGAEVVFVPLEPDADLRVQTQPVLVDTAGRVFAIAQSDPNATSLYVHTPGDATFQPWPDDAVSEFADPILGAADVVFVGLSGMGTPGDPAPQGVELMRALAPEGEVLWQYLEERPTDWKWEVLSVFDALGRIAMVVRDEEQVELVLLTAGGERLWSLPIAGTLASEPAVGEDGTVYVLTDGYGLLITLTAVSPNGEVRWQVGVGALATFGSVSMALSGEGPVVRCESAVVALDEDGNERFRDSLIDSLASVWLDLPGLAVAEDGTVYYSGNGPSESEPPRELRGFLHAVGPDGEVHWIVGITEEILGGPTLGGDGLIYLTTCESVFAYRPDGSVLFQRPLPETPDGCYGDTEREDRRPYLFHPILDAEGRLYIGTAYGGVVVVSDGPGAAR